MFPAAALQFAAVPAGEFNDQVFEGLDFVVAEARRRRIFVILTLVNYWQDYGGMLQVGSADRTKVALLAELRASARGGLIWKQHDRFTDDIIAG